MIQRKCSSCEEEQEQKRVQPKMAVSSPEDPLEREANRIADEVTGAAGGATSIARSAVTGGQRAAEAAVGAHPLVGQALRSGGQPLDEGTRAELEPRFGVDFGRVRVHTGATAAESARAVSAHAYTVGADIVFGAGHAPKTREWKHLLAHELTHVVQQGGAPAGIQRKADDDATAKPQDQDQTGGTQTGFWSCLGWKLKNEQEKMQHCKNQSAAFCQPGCNQYPEESKERKACMNCCWCHVLNCVDSSCGEYPQIFAEEGCKPTPGMQCGNKMD